MRKTPASLSWPLIGALLLFSAFPFAYLIGLSLTDSTLARPLNGFSGLDNYADALASTAFKSSLWRSALFAVGAALLQLALGTALALLLAIRGRRLGWLGVALLLPLVTPPVMVGVAWKLLLAPVGGALPEIADTLGSSGFNPLGSSLGAFVSLLAIDTWQWTPFVTLLLYAALLGVPRELLDAARIDGASTRQLLRHVILPLIAGTLVAVFLLRLVIAFKVFDIVYVVTSGGPGFATTLSAFDIYRTGLQDFQVGEAAAATVVFSLLVGIFVTVVSRLHKRVREVAP
ncbi:sugar ABC transporter permease [Conexibacter sp. JD483]|uniref:carbohydrate ABC transporter permease n=1 Tax=unclassified Conexibacter TaxID=2627773 RepID=UPI00271830BF|nr:MULTISPECIES: sugar ABC transporter permease [unclassified Conexibacter]MDO8184910.1 sugar ABC transporter permease [Conexibacter sp. CPCC 205706]MDO8198054.1 sugar ABC transporter permease [Conexibacter sp. CPCC 205762]MDR9372943.1 sugar ABC transporter permease [Conexibacter sp. JD483]